MLQRRSRRRERDVDWEREKRPTADAADAADAFKTADAALLLILHPKERRTPINGDDDADKEEQVEGMRWRGGG